MKLPVSDSAVTQYVERLRAGGPLGTLLPAPLSECDFTDAQRAMIRQARADKKALLKKSKLQPSKAGEPQLHILPPVQVTDAKRPQARPLTKLRKMLYLQSGRCFFCGEPLSEDDATIEHLNPRSRGGCNSEDNVVVCHSSLNQTFGAMDLKRKFEFVLKSAGAFSCPAE